MMYNEQRKVPKGLVVRITNCSKYHHNLNGKMATVVNGEYDDVRLDVENMYNNNASEGHYYVPRSCLEIEMTNGSYINLRQWLKLDYTERTRTTEKETIKMLGNYTVVKAKYIDSVEEAIDIMQKAEWDDGALNEDTRGQYEFACFDPAIKIGDAVLVKSAHHGFGLAVIISARPKTHEDDTKVSREVISHVDMESYSARVNNRHKAAELKEQMERRAKELQDIVLYETLAANDAKMLELLTEFKDLT